MTLCIDFIITELNPGGAERALTELAIGCSTAGDDVRVFSIGSRPRPPKDELIRQLEIAGIEVTFADCDRSIDLLTAARSLRRWLQQKPNSVRQSFLFHANVLLGTVAPRGNRLFAGIRVAEKRAGRLIAERTVLRRFEKIVCVSSAVGAFASTFLRVPGSRCVTIPNGVDVDRFSRAVPLDWRSLNWPVDTEVVLFIGRFHRQKGLELLMQSLEQIIPKMSNRKLILIGDGPLRGQLEAWAGRSDGRVWILPWQADVAPFLSACRVLVLPSHYEGMPNVVLEAMAAGKPVVCSRVEGTRELLGEDPVQCFDSGDAAAMTTRLLQILEDPMLGRRLGQQNQSRVAATYTIPAMIKAYRDLYQRRRDGD